MSPSKLALASTVTLSSGFTMPRLGFGIYQNRDLCRESVLKAFEAGYRHVDCAQVYRNEEACGTAMRESGIPRTELFITSKCNSKTHGYESTLAGVNISLQKLQLDYIDLFLIHDAYSGSERRLATYKALQECKLAGKIRSVGVSNYGIRHLEEIRATGFEMPSLHPFCQQKPIVEYCTANNIAVQAYCPLLRGETEDPTIHAIAQAHSKDFAQVLLRWSLQSGFTPLPKSATPSRITSNAELYDFELTEDEMEKLDGLDMGKEGAISWNPIDAI